MKATCTASAVVSLLTLISFGQAWAEDIIVNPGGGTTIQQAVDGAVNGDVIVLTDGIFSGAGNRDINFDGKAITIRSQNGAGAVTIDCGGVNRAFRFQNGETGSSVVENLTIENGFHSNNGAGIFILGASPTIRGCVISGCTSDSGGGGIYCEGVGGGTFEDCEIISCSSGSTDGGGILVKAGANPTFINCEIRDNLAANGAGIAVDGNAGLTIEASTIHGNVASVDGGGLYASVGNAGVNLTTCILYNNTAVRGGGIRLQDTSAVAVTSCTIADNAASHSGSGVSVNGDATFTKTIIANNTGSVGASANCAAGSVTIVGCLLVGGHTTDVEGASCFLGTLLQEPPQFCGSPGSHNYRLQSDSPAAGIFPNCPDILGAVTDSVCGGVPTETRSWGGLKAAYH